jgi:beta-phosphoglucomutase-like phosphatase (HAD superfamily)
MKLFADFNPDVLEVLLCDADGNLFPSEEPAFDASVTITNAFLRRFGLPGNLSAAELRVATTGKNFRTTAVDLAVAGGVPVERALADRYHGAAVANEEQTLRGEVLTCAELEVWVARERDAVTKHLGVSLMPDAAVCRPLDRLSLRYSLAAVSSSSSVRLRACFTATGLDTLIPPGVRFSAEDSLPVPTSKPDPAIYRLAGEALGIRGAQGLAIEDSVPGVASAVAAGFPTVGNVMFVPQEERATRASELWDEGACALIESWWQLCDLIGYPDPEPDAHDEQRAKRAL